MPRRILALTALAAVLLAACGDDDDQSTAGDVPATEDQADHGGDGHDDDQEDSPVAEGAREIEITARDLAFDPDRITAEIGEDLAIVLTSEDLVHDFTIDDLDVHVVAGRGETSEGGLTADQAGEFTFYCSVPGHRSAGMEGTLTVE